MSKYTITLTPRSTGVTALRADLEQRLRFYKGRRRLVAHHGWDETRRQSLNMVTKGHR